MNVTSYKDISASENVYYKLDTLRFIHNSHDTVILFRTQDIPNKFNVSTCENCVMSGSCSDFTEVTEHTLQYSGLSNSNDKFYVTRAYYTTSNTVIHDDRYVYKFFDAEFTKFGNSEFEADKYNNVVDVMINGKLHQNVLNQYSYNSRIDKVDGYAIIENDLIIRFINTLTADTLVLIK